MKEDWIPRIFKTGEYTDNFLDNFWNPKKYLDPMVLPRVISPLHVMGYNAHEVYEKLSKYQLLPKNRSSQTKTNCELVYVLSYIDWKSRGYCYGFMSNAYLRRKGMLEKNNENIMRKSISRLGYFMNLLLIAATINKSIRKMEKMLNINFKKILMNNKTSDDFHQQEYLDW